jgi:hypothetical protein
MPRAVSIHIGVNDPRDHHVLLRHSEDGAWGMAGLASQAGYDSILVLRGPAATRAAVHEALAGAAGTLACGDTLLVSFSGHGGQVMDRDMDERHGSDESWCLYDGELLDDKLAGYWRLFDSGIRIVVVSESCYSGGMNRTGDKHAAYAAGEAAPRVMRGGLVMRSGLRTPGLVTAAAAEAVASCIAEPPRDCFEIRASVLMLTASTEQQPAEEGLFTRCLLDVWAGGDFRGSYCRFYEEVKRRVMTARSGQEPQILMLGAPDPAFPLEPAFHLDRTREPRETVRYR